MSSTRRPRTLTAALVTAAALGAVVACGSPGVAAPDRVPVASSSSAPAPVDPTGTTAMGTQRTITRDGHDVAFYVTAGSGAVIVLDAGGGEDASYWNALVPVLAQQTGATVVTYDRTGSGRSSDVPGAFSAAAAADDLAAGLQGLGLVREPVVLVSHSLAGEVATYLVDDHPGLVQGAVLVDANVPQFFTPQETARLVAATDEQAAQVRAAPQTRQTRQALAVADGFGPAHTAYHALTWPSDLPVAVIVSERTPMPAGSPDAEAWRAAQQHFADAAPDRTLVTARDSSHDVALDRPDVVEQQIGDVLAQVRSQVR
ncbi:alpha/beta fold hydrolase [Kineococcus rhizosphaerae]|uniref:Pimeloyl-ACP methyl ester carboxylesterase n=1 Tax=Kineococcus rhizosphaerae TaxID=559628 RepID=A0A2T0QXJ9_9ACTN|nr:alpha/beta hydrolase [Kineococcus rhizosphaerae]PRY10743.1 pimeloyl-ACP methyl ester carboxylesterase [Kineococcus rhizosphaerae]